MDAIHHLHIAEILKHRAAAQPLDPAIAAPGYPTVSYRDLHRQTKALASALSAHGIVLSDRVAVALPEGPDLAGAILAVSCVAVCAPLNSEYQAAEFRFHLAEMNARAILVSADSPAGALVAARELGLTILNVERCVEGLLTLYVDADARQLQPNNLAADDAAILLYTSGTTAKPKGVLLSHRNLCLSAANMADTLALCRQDKCISVMPLFHIHGLVGTLLAPLVSGGTSIQPGRFHGARFFEQLEVANPTWLTGTPAILHQIAERAAGSIELAKTNSLRLIRSASAPLPASLLSLLESQFEVPIIEAYGMTEASHQIASNPLPPEPRKPGSVGIPSGPEVAIHGLDGEKLEAGVSGEIVIRGENVITRYLANESSNVEEFRDGWLRTGDQGFIDADGYLFIDGRLKEMINRGGEKVSPFEVEAVLNNHPAVAESGVFALPDPRLGEEIAACIVVNDGHDLVPRTLQDFASERLAAFKIPRHVFFAPSLPKSTTGKLQRTALGLLFEGQVGESLPLGLESTFAAPRGEIELQLAAIWEEILAVDGFSREDNFFDYGGDSLQAVMVIARVREELGIDLPITAFFDSPTIAKLANEIDAAAGEGVAAPLARTNFSDAFRPLSFTQQLIVELSQDLMFAKSAAFNRTAALQISGPLDVGCLGRALDAIVERHEVLRINVVTQENVLSARVCPHQPCKLSQYDLRDLDAAQQDARLRAITIDFGAKAYDLAQDKLVRFALIRQGENENVLLVCAHYLVFDGWSMRIFLDELAAHYGVALGLSESGPAPPPIQYADFAKRQWDRLDAGALDEQMAYWRQQFADEPPHIVFDRAEWTRPDNRFELEQRERPLSANLTRSLRGLGLRHDATLFMVLLAALNVMWSRLEGPTDIVLLSQSAGRSERRTEGLIGNFVNTFPIRSRLSPDQTFVSHLAAVRSACLGAIENQEVPFARLIGEILPDRNPLLDPISPLLFMFKNYSLPPVAVGATKFTPLDLDHQWEMFGLIIKVREGTSDLPVTFSYNRLVVTDEQARALESCYHKVLEQIAANPDHKIKYFLTLRTLIGTLGLRTVIAEALRKLVGAIRRNDNHSGI